jgi:hypothetical protein
LFLPIFLREISGNRSLIIQIIGEGIDGIKKERQAVRSKIKVLEDELKLVDAEIASLQVDLDAATARKDKAYESLTELRTVRDAKVSLTYFYLNCPRKNCVFPFSIIMFNTWVKKRETLFLLSSAFVSLFRYTCACLWLLLYLVHCVPPRDGCVGLVCLLFCFC